jgi:hypothetical protein
MFILKNIPIGYGPRYNVKTVLIFIICSFLDSRLKAWLTVPKTQVKLTNLMELILHFGKSKWLLYLKYIS